MIQVVLILYVFLALTTYFVMRSTFDEEEKEYEAREGDTKELKSKLSELVFVVSDDEAYVLSRYAEWLFTEGRAYKYPFLCKFLTTEPGGKYMFPYFTQCFKYRSNLLRKIGLTLGGVMVTLEDELVRKNYPVDECRLSMADRRLLWMKAIFDHNELEWVWN